MTKAFLLLGALIGFGWLIRPSGAETGDNRQYPAETAQALLDAEMAKVQLVPLD